MMAPGAALLKNRRDMLGVVDFAGFFQSAAPRDQAAFDIRLSDRDLLAVQQLLDGLLQIGPARLLMFEIVADAIVDASSVANGAPQVEHQGFGCSPRPGYIENELPVIDEYRKIDLEFL